MKNDKKITLLTTWMILLSCLYLISWTYTYDTATPAGGDDPAEADDRMREIKAAVQERLAVEHTFALTGTEVSDANTGEHTDITTDSITNAGTLVNTGTITASGAVTVGTTLDVNGNIDPTTYETTNGGFLDEDDMASDANDKTASQQSIKAYVAAITDPAYSGGESHTFEGGLIMKMGTTTGLTHNSDNAITFGTAFPTACITVVATMNRSGAVSANMGVTAKATTGFTVYIGNTVTGAEWIAIGY